MACKHTLPVRILKWLLITVAVILLLGGAASWYISVKYKPLMKEALTDLVSKSTDSLYHIKFSKIHTNFLTGGASVSDVEIIPDTNAYKRLVAEEKAPNNIYRLKLKKLVIRHFHPWRIYHDRKLNIDELQFERPELTMTNKQYAFNDDQPPRPRRSPYAIISKFFTEASVKTVSLTDISFKYINNNSDVPVTDSVANLNIYLSDYLLDKDSPYDTTRLYLFKDLRIALNNYSYQTDDKMYKLSLEQLDFAAKGGKLNIKKFAMEPAYDEMKFGQVAGYSRDRFDIKMNDISFTGLNLPAYVRKREVRAKDMHIANGSVAVFSDNSLPKRVVDKTGKFPHQLLQKLGTDLTIQTIFLNNIMISYSEFDRDSRQRGQITFEQTAGTIANATNAADSKKANPIMKARLTTMLMGKGPMNVNFDFNLLAQKGDFSLDGKLGEMDGKAMNRITRPLGMVAVNRAKVKSLAFNFKADDSYAKGSMAFAFNDLSVSVLKKDKKQDKLVRQGWISFLANNFVLSSDNPNANGVFIKAPIVYKRPATASFFSYVWRSLFTGIRYSVGVTPQKEAEIREKIAQFEKMKNDRNLRRAAREKRKNLQKEK